MKSNETPSRLSLPVPFEPFPNYLLSFELPRQQVHKLFGPPHLTEWVDGLGNGDFWGLEFSCGLLVLIQFMHFTEVGIVTADSPEIDHVIRHLPICNENLYQIETNLLEEQLQRLLEYFPNRKMEIELLNCFQVWRQGEDGNPFKVGNPTSERDAGCIVKHFETLGHKQTYWYSKII